MVCLVSCLALLLDMTLFLVYVSDHGGQSVEMLGQYILNGKAGYTHTETFLDYLQQEAELRLYSVYADELFGENFNPTTSRSTVDLMYGAMATRGASGVDIYYRLGDLLDWDLQLYLMDTNSFNTTKILIMQNAERHLPEEDVFPVYSGSYACVINEKFRPTSGRSLYSYASDVYSLSVYSRNLLNTIEYVKHLYEVYRITDTESNLQIAVTDKRGRLIYSDFDISSYTASELSSADKALEELLTVQGGYWMISRDDGKLIQTNLPGVRSEFPLWELSVPLQEDHTLYLWIDTAYPAADNLRIGMQVFEDTVQTMLTMLIIFAVFAVLLLVALVRRTMLEGREGQKQRLINGWKTLFLPLEVMFVGYIFMYMIDQAAYRVNNLWRAVYVLTLCILMCLVFFANLLYFYLEFVRRIKERTLWEKSFLKWCVNCLKKIGRLILKLFSAIGRLLLIIPGKPRFALGYLGYLVCNLFMVAMAFGFSSLAPIVLAGILDLLVGALFLAYFKEQDRLRMQMQAIAGGEARMKLLPQEFHLDNRKTAEIVNVMDAGIQKAVATSLKDERLKAELITNVSHDIKTPLTSIINYVDLLKKEPLETENEKQYVEVLAEKSARLKNLIDDLMEASKISSGNITVESVPLSVGELLSQMTAEYEARFESRQLTPVLQIPEYPLYFMGDSRHIWRVLSNLFSNLCKYAMPGTRIYLEAGTVNAAGVSMAGENAAGENAAGEMVEIRIKNISEKCLNVSAEELMERFVRGDESRNTEGNGLGLSIAKSLTDAMNGKLTLAIDGDLFKVTLRFPQNK